MGRTYVENVKLCNVRREAFLASEPVAPFKLLQKRAQCLHAYTAVHPFAPLLQQ